MNEHWCAGIVDKLLPNTFKYTLNTLLIRIKNAVKNMKFFNRTFKDFLFKPKLCPLVIAFTCFLNTAIILPLGMVRGIGKTLSFKGDATEILINATFTSWSAGKIVSRINL